MGNERLPRDNERGQDSEPAASMEEALAIIEALKRSVAEERKAKEDALSRVEEEQRLRQEAEERAKWDPLLRTMLNQRAAMERLEQLVEEGEPFGVYLIDLDNFKGYNDTYGHPAGDRLLLLLELIFQENLNREDDRCELARIGGDEFFVLVMIKLAQDGRRSSDPLQQMENFREIILRQRVEAQLLEREPRARAVNVGLSVGSEIFYPEQPLSAETLKEHADRKLYEDKRQRKGSDSSR